MTARSLSPSIDALRGCSWNIASCDAAAIADVGEVAGRHGAAAARVSTCQRIEVYGFEPCECDSESSWTGLSALQRMAEVAAGLHSAVLGEEQVLGQVRTALVAADPEIQQIGALALAAARELRRSHVLAGDTGELLDLALQLAESPARGEILILGTGHMARAVARRALALGFHGVTIAGRTPPGWLVPPMAWATLETAPPLKNPVAVVGCLGAGAPAIDPNLFRVDQLLVDLGTPRNFLESADRPRLVTILDVLETAALRNAAQSASLTADLAAILTRRVDMATATSATSVGRMRLEIERARQREVDRIRRLHPELPPETIEVITRSLVNRLFHSPAQRLAEDGDADFRERVADLFAASEGAV